MRSIQFVRSTQYHSGEAVSACLALAGTLSASVMRSLFPSFQHPLSCLPSLGATLLSALFRLPLRSLGSRVRPPARRRFPGCLALFRSSALRYYEGSDSCFPSPRVTGLPACLAQTSQRSASNHVGAPGVALHAMTAHPVCFRLRPLSAGSPTLPAESSSSPADRQFASGCSPPHLAVTQLPSATGPWLTPTRTLTVLFARLHGRTGRGFSPDAVVFASPRGGLQQWVSVKVGRRINATRTRPGV